MALGLPLKPLILLAMATGTSIKQIYWVSYTAKEELNPTASIVVAFVNTILNSTNSILSLTAFAAAYNPAFLSAENKHGVSPLLILGTIGFIAGLGAEAISETQRKIFKDDEKNAGKPFTGGLFGLARHINYASYTLWRASYALVSGGWVWAALSGAFFTSDFLTRAIPVLDEYCVNRVGFLQLLVGLSANTRNSMVSSGQSIRRKFRTLSSPESIESSNSLDIV